MSWHQQWMVVSDLDGTLLDHVSYSWEPAAAMLQRLREHQVPVVLASSKTLAEMRRLAAEMSLSEPMIVENGAAVAWPEEGDYRVEAVGRPRSEIIPIIHQLRAKHDWRFVGFDDWSASDLAEDSGLGMERAALALDRHGTEPLLWHDDETAYGEFLDALAAEGLRAVRGGRYIHVMGQFDKADGLHRVAEALAGQRGGPLKILALGDSPNDEAMLSAADVAVRIRSSKSGEMQIEAPVLLQPGPPGPYGWAEALDQWWQAQGKPIPPNPSARGQADNP